MKKVLVVLLIAVLAIGAVFADSSSFTGELSTTLKYDLDAEAFTLEQDVDVTASFAFALFNGSLSGANAGEGYPYAEIEGSLDLAFDDFAFSFGNTTNQRLAANSSFWGKDSTSLYASTGVKAVVDAGLVGKWVGVDTANTKLVWYDDDGNKQESTDAYTSTKTFYEVYDARVLRWDWSVDDAYDIFTKANIIGENWSVDLLKNAAEGDFAVNTIGDYYTFKASKYVGSTSVYDLNNAVKEGDGLTFVYDGYTVGLGNFAVNNENNKASDSFTLSVQSKDYALAEGVTATVGANYTLNKYEWHLNPSAKVAYEGYDVNAVVAADVAIADEKGTEFDVSVDADYLEEAVKFDFYYASKATAKSPYQTIAAINKAVYSLSYSYAQDTGLPSFKLALKNSKDSEIATAKINSVSLEQFMSGVVSVDVAKFVSLGEVSALSVTVEGHDMVNEDRGTHAWNAELAAAAENYGVSGKFGAKKFTDEDNRRFYAEVTTDFAKVAELPVNSLTLTVGSNDVDMDANVKSTSASSNVDCLYASVTSEINDAVTVGLTGNYIAGKNRYDIFGVNATFTGVEGLSLTAAVDHVFAADQDNDTTVEFSGSYTCDFVTVTALVQGEFADEDEASSTFGAYVGAESTALVNGATIGLYYSELNDDGDVSVNWTDPGNAGYVAAVCKLAF